jgi:hypothetical protein
MTMPNNIREIDPARLLAAAERARAAGKSEAEVNRVISNATGGRITTVAALQESARLVSATESAAEPEPRPGLLGRARQNVREGLAETRDVLRMVGQGATFGFGDEIAGAAAAVIPGGRGYTEARDASRDNLARIRGGDTIHPLVAGAAEVTGGVAVPLGAVGNLMGRGAGIGAAALRGAGIGAAGGAVYGAGEADELSDTPGNTIRGGLLGGVTGGAFGAGGGVAARGVRALRDPLRAAAPEAGAELSARLKSGAGVGGEVAPVREAATQRARQVFAELDKLAELDHPTLRSVLRTENIAKAAGVADDVAAGARAPSFKEAQAAHQRIRGIKDRALRNADMDSYQQAARMESELFNALQDATSSRYGHALPDYAREMAAVRAVQQGYRTATKAADEIEAAYRALADNPEAQHAFREGVAARIVQGLESGSVESFIRRAETPQFQRKLAVVFNGDTDAVRRFMDDVSRSAPGSRAEMFASIRRWAFRGAVGGTAAAGTYTAAKGLLDF